MLILGHRGEPRLAPENTMASFALVRGDLDRGVDGVEFDVQMTRDGELVVIHDETVDRTTDGQGWVKDLSLAEIRRLDAGVRFQGSPLHQRIPTLEEVFELFDGTRATINAELKNSVVPYEGMESLVLALAARFRLGGLVLSSFNIRSMGVVRELDAQCRTGLLFAPWLMRMPDVIAHARATGANAIHPFVLNVHTRFARLVHAAGLGLVPWTVDSPTQVRRCAALGADIIISNEPRVAAHSVATLGADG
jgi:glycerophosphoryl diester phosphodiesterase